MNRPELASLSLEERRKIQREAGLVTANSINQDRNRHKPHRKERYPQMDQPHTHTHSTNEQSRAQQTVQEFIRQVKQQDEPMLKTAKRAGVYAAIWAPVGLGVGYGLLRMARRIFTNATL